MLPTVPARRLVAAAATLALTATTLALAAPAATASDTAPTITDVTLNDEYGGLSPYIPTACALVVLFTDPTPSPDTGYRVSVTTQDGEHTTERNYAYAPDSDPTKHRSVVDCPTTVDGDLYDVVVTETAHEDTPTSEPFVYELAVTGHPDDVRIRTERTDGTRTEFIAGDVVHFTHQGEWEPGTRFATRVWTSKTSTFTGDDYDDNRSGTGAIVTTYDSPDLPASFTIPTRAQGRWVWISVLGEKAGKVRWLYTFNPVRVSDNTDTPDTPDAGPKVQPKKWIKNFGSVTKKPRVGKISKVTSAPTLSKAGKAAKLKVTYRWVTGKKNVIKGATKKRYRVPAKHKGKTLSVYVILTKNGYQARFKKIKVGVIR